MSNFRVHVLGCSSAKPTLRHNPSCTVLNIRDSLYMIDCGEGAQKQMIRECLKFSRLNNIFLTHLHGDHVLGLPGLLSTLSLHGKQGYVTIYTTAEGINWLKSEMHFFGGSLSYELRFVEVKPTQEQVVYEDHRLSVRTLPLEHRVPCVGYIFEEKPKPRHIDKSACDYHKVPISFYKELQRGVDYVKSDGIVIPNSHLTRPASLSSSYAHIGDTAYVPSNAAKIGNVSLMYHETTYLNTHSSEASLRGHSTASQAAHMALSAGVSRLLIGHYSSRYKNDSLFLEEAKSIFPNTILADEGLVVEL